MAKFYAVKNGRKVGIFSTWEECQKQVVGFKGAIYKSFKTKEEAEAYLNEREIISEKPEKVEGVYAYIDGSYDRINDMVNNNSKYAEEAAKFVMWYAVDKKISEITLFYDYQGIESWATGKWKTNLDYTKNYKEFADKVSTRVKVNFVKVKAHTGVELNERVDKLAKEAIAEFKKNKM